MTTAYGPVREVMFAPTSNVNDVHSFLIRDDAYARSSAVLGRTLRLGDPIDTGAVSAAYQTTWSGGRDQTIFNDTSMFLDSTLDSTDPSGRLKMWMGIEPIVRSNNSPARIISSSEASDFSQNSILWAEYYASGTYLKQKKVASPFTQGLLANFPSLFVTSLCQLDQTGGAAPNWVAIGFSNGNFGVVDCTSGTYQDRTTTTGIKDFIWDMVPYKRKLVVLMGRILYSVDTNSSGVTSWTEIVSFNQGNALRGSIAVVNDVLYILVPYQGGRCALFASDGTSATLLHTFENTYPLALHSLKGKLFLHMYETAFTASNPYEAKASTVLYQYSGNSMRKLFSRSNPFQYFIESTDYAGYSGIWGDYLAISYTEKPKTFGSTVSRSAGFILYDPDNDSFHGGPSINGIPSGCSIGDICESNGALYFFLCDNTNNDYIICSTRRDSFASKWSWYGLGGTIAPSVASTQQIHSLISSSFDAGLPDQQKTWLRVNVKHNLQIGTNTATDIPTMKVYVRTSSNDYDSTQYLIGTYTPTVGVSGWRTTSFDIAWTGTKFPKSNQLRYVIELTYPHSSGNQNGATLVYNAMIDSVSVEYMLVATPKKVWRARVLCDDDQLKLNNNANVLDTRLELVDKLFEYWEDGQPLYFWDASSTSVTPTSNNYDHIVMITDIGENSYRVDDRGEEVNSEVSLTIYEVA